MRPASQCFFIHSCIYLRILIISYLATFLGTNSLSLLMCREAVDQSINQSINQKLNITITFNTDLWNGSDVSKFKMADADILDLSRLQFRCQKHILHRSLSIHKKFSESWLNSQKMEFFESQIGCRPSCFLEF